MKRIISLILTAMIAIAVFAKSPNLACEKILERKELRSPGHNLVSVTNENNIFRSITAESDIKLQKDIKKAFDQDRKRAHHVVEGYDDGNGQEYAILNIQNNGELISIGFFWREDGFVNLFISGTPAAFK